MDADMAKIERPPSTGRCGPAPASRIFGAPWGAGQVVWRVAMARLVADQALGRKLPEPIPADSGELLELLDDAATYAAAGQGQGAPRFDHGMRLFQQAHAHYQAVITEELSRAHHDLAAATKALKLATWWLAGVTVLLGAVEA